MNNERRLKPRYEIAMPIEIDGVRCLTRNVSINGVIFYSPVALEIGREIHFTLVMRAGNCRLNCRGKVIRQRMLPDSTYDTGASIVTFVMEFDGQAAGRSSPVADLSPIS